MILLGHQTLQHPLERITYGKDYKIEHGRFKDDCGCTRMARNCRWKEEEVKPMVGVVDGKEVVSDGKADSGKTRMSLLYVQFGGCLTSIAKVLTFGAKKYPKPPLDDSWRDVPNAKERYSDAALRHFNAYFVEGEKLDPESGESHLAHLMCCLLFIWRLDDEK